jgi:uncharacterized RDD family membrane protein YckC
MEQQDLLLDLEKDFYLEKASRGARFANYFIDAVAITFLERAVNYGLSYFSLRLYPLSQYDYGYNSGLDLFQAAIYSLLRTFIITWIFNVLYYTLLEGATQGRTLGKLVTGTKAVTKEGLPITWKEALLRSFCRIVPFEVFSGFGTPWHDRWSSTQVVRISR